MAPCWANFVGYCSQCPGILATTGFARVVSECPISIEILSLALQAVAASADCCHWPSRPCSLAQLGWLQNLYQIVLGPEHRAAAAAADLGCWVGLQQPKQQPHSAEQ